MNKSALRELYKSKRLAISDSDKAIMDEQIRQNLQPLIVSGKKIGVFLPISRQREIDLFPLLENKAIQWCVSKSNGMNRSMTFYLYEGLEQLVENSWGIPEPSYGQIVQPDELDVVLIPMLICDKTGHRVGYGKGFYDRFLLQCRKDCVFVGVNYWKPIQQIEDVHNDDIQLHWCITPENSFELS